MNCNTEIPPPPKMTPGASTIQLCSDFQSWLLWAKEYHPTAPLEIRAEAERRAQLCESSLDDNTKTDKLEAKPMAKPKQKPKPAAEPPINKRAVYVHSSDGELTDSEINKTYLKPQVTAALNMQSWSGELSVHGIRTALVTEIDEVAKGNMARPEAMLLCQAHTLDFLFSQLAQKANNQQHMPNYEGFMRMALKAQNQCRMTLETLSNLKNPPVIFAKQANFSGGGHQQVNNGVPASRTEENKNLQNKILLEETHYAGTTLDTGATGTVITVNKELEALGEDHGAKIGSG
jgi:hypothetical protein